MLGPITDLLNENLTRVENLVSLYGPEKPGRRRVQDTDILRGALVLLHAGLEDYLRSLMVWKIDTYPPEVLNNYMFPNGNNKRGIQKISLGELASSKGRLVDDVIKEVVKSHLDRYQSFNDLGEVKTALKQCGIAPEAVEARNFGKLHEMIARRHNIVHKADRNDVIGGQGNHGTQSLRKGTVEGYVASVKDIRDFVTDSL